MTVDEMIFKPVPPQILDSVPEAIWKETLNEVKKLMFVKNMYDYEIYDKAMMQFRQAPQNQRSCCQVFCRLGLSQSQRYRSNLFFDELDAAYAAEHNIEKPKWEALVSWAQSKYSPYGIRVTSGTQRVQLAVRQQNESKRWINMITGLKFEFGAVASTMGIQIAMPAVTQEDSAIDKIIKLAKLKDAGVLTEKEFATKKEQLLREV